MSNHDGIFDTTGAKLQIIPHTRQITVPDTCKIIGVAGDDRSEQVTFQCPMIIDGHNVSECAEHIVMWQDPNGKKGADNLDVVVDKDNELVYLAWTVDGRMTTVAGTVAFSIRFQDPSGYKWATAECRECSILDSVHMGLGKFERIYVSGDTLVFADSTPIGDETLELGTNGIFPSGTGTITENGDHDVYALDSVHVAVPAARSLTVSVDAESNVVVSDGAVENDIVQPLSDLDINFVAENIRAGKYVLGVFGTSPDKPVSYCKVWLNQLFGMGYSTDARYQYLDKDGRLLLKSFGNGANTLIKGAAVYLYGDIRGGGRLKVDMIADGITIDVGLYSLVEQDDRMVLLLPFNEEITINVCVE